VPEVPIVETPPAEETPPQETTPPTHEEIAGIVTEAFRQNQSGPAAAAPPPLTTEEIEERMKVAKFDDQFATQLHQELMAEEFNPQNVVSILHDMRDRLNTQAQTYTELALTKHQMDMDAKYAPALEALQEQRNQAKRDFFYTSHPDLKPFDRLLPIAAQAVLQSGARFSTPAEEQKAIASEAEKLIKQVNPNFKLGQARSGEPTPASTMRGGQVGAGEVTAPRTNGADPSIM
jgi:hypothetical protein